MELPFLLLLRGLSDLRIAELHQMQGSFSIKLHSECQPAVWARLGVDPLDMPRTPYWATERKSSQ